MTRQKAMRSCAVLVAGAFLAIAAAPTFADSGDKQKSPPPRHIDVHVGKVTKSPDHPSKHPAKYDNKS